MLQSELDGQLAELVASNIYMRFSSPDDSWFTLRYHEEGSMLLSAIDCVLHGEKAVYCSSELTTGARMNHILQKYKLRSPGELHRKMGEDWFRKHILGPNVESAVAFARYVRSKVIVDLVLTPAPFLAPGWSQPQYLGFWEIVLRTRIKSVWFDQHWQFSNGCVYEFEVAQIAGLPAQDHEGNILDLQKGIAMVSDAIRQMQGDGLDVSVLKQCLDSLRRNAALAEGTRM